MLNIQLAIDSVQEEFLSEIEKIQAMKDAAKFLRNQVRDQRNEVH